jgi:TfoX/Sxy family transcriptional regulator of competence genes
MAYDEELAERVRDLIGDRKDVTEKRMFGGLAMLVNGNMAVAIRGGGGLMLRVDPDGQDVWLDDPGVEVAVMRGRPMAGWLNVSATAVRTPAKLRTWVDRAMAYAGSLPAK